MTLFTFKTKYSVLLIVIMLFGVYLRFVNISPYLFYPDAYQNLLVAEHIKNIGQVVGTLGNKGMLFPQYVMWARPLYPLLINLAHYFVPHSQTAAQIMAYVSGVLAIPLSFLLVREVFRSEKAGLIASFLIAASANHVIWSGFVMSDTTGILLALLYLYFLFKTYKRKSELLAPLDLLVGVILSFSVFARFEYILLFVPTVFLLYLSGQSFRNKLATISAAFIFVSSLMFTLLFPIGPTISLFFNQLRSLLVVSSVGLISLVVLYIIFIKIPPRFLVFIQNAVSSLFFMASIFSLLIPLFNLHLPYFVGLRNFIYMDFLLISLAFLGIGLMFLSKKYSALSTFLIMYIVVMFSIYIRTNPLQQRYNTHLLPPLVIAASYGSFYVFSLIQKTSRISAIIISIVLMIGLVCQIYISFYGIRKWDNGLWFETSYEEDSARKVDELLEENDLLVVSMPEPYYFFTHNTTRSVTNVSPYIFIDDVSDDTNIVIVNDMGLRDIFPEFVQKVEGNVEPYTIGRYMVDKPYYYITEINEYEKETIVYRVTKKDLLELLK